MTKKMKGYSLSKALRCYQITCICHRKSRVVSSQKVDSSLETRVLDVSNVNIDRQHL